MAANGIVNKDAHVDLKPSICSVRLLSIYAYDSILIEHLPLPKHRLQPQLSSFQPIVDILS